MREWFLEFDLRRLESYARNLVDYHMVLDLVPHMARLYFCGRLPVTLSAAQSAILLSLGLQHKSVSDVEAELGLASNQVLALFNKAVRKISLHLRGLEESAAARDVAAEDAAAAAAGGAGPASAKKPTPLREPLQRELKDAAKKHAQDSARAAQLREAAPPVDLAGLEHYAIAGSEQDWDAALGKGGVVAPATISVRSSGDKAKRREQQLKRAARGEAPDADKGAHQHKKGRTQ
jgi:N-acetyltransferase 10